MIVLCFLSKILEGRGIIEITRCCV